MIHVTAQFDSAAGVYEGNKIAVLGMPVGKVTKITPKGGYVEIQFNVDKNIPIPADAQAVTISTSILTDRQIELTPPYKSGPKLQDHATIGLNRTKTPIEFARTLDLLNNLTGAVVATDKETARSPTSSTPVPPSPTETAKTSSTRSASCRKRCVSATTGAR